MTLDRRLLKKGVVGGSLGQDTVLLLPHTLLLTDSCQRDSDYGDSMGHLAVQAGASSRYARVFTPEHSRH